MVAGVRPRRTSDTQNSVSVDATASLRFSSKSSSPILFIQFRSAPAQNTLPRPASTTARTAGSRSSSPKAAVSSAIIVSLKALRTSGRLSQRTATPRPAWISMVSCVMLLPPDELSCKSLTRPDDHLGPHRIGDEALLVRLVVQFGEHLR